MLKTGTEEHAHEQRYRQLAFRSSKHQDAKGLMQLLARMWFSIRRWFTPRKPAENSNRLYLMRRCRAECTWGTSVYLREVEAGQSCGAGVRGTWSTASRFQWRGYDRMDDEVRSLIFKVIGQAH